MVKTQGRVSEARSRLLGTATRIFYTEGIHSVGIDRIVAEAQVTRATLYRHFAGKEELVLAYLEGVSQLERDQLDQAIAGADSAADSIRAVAKSITAGITSDGFRGCAFLNAAAEYPDPEHPVHQAVLAHRDWFATTIATLFTQLGDASPEPPARHFIMLRDGAMATGCLTDPTQVCETFLQGVEGLLTYRTATTAKPA
ncbi:TetR/AcrR family transcriptional regulator [Kribbella sp. NBC_00382]|uniref:TetR/AcrR family transcriptional regulator n=1 Tax=Kribbella sp. NBC_00382 TaxID=2975967 RepID=UPI002E247600